MEDNIDFEDIFDNLDSELDNLKIRLSKNVYGIDILETLSTFLKLKIYSL